MLHASDTLATATTSGLVTTRPETGCELAGDAYPVVHCARLGRVDFDTLEADDSATWTTCPSCGGGLAHA